MSFIYHPDAIAQIKSDGKPKKGRFRCIGCGKFLKTFNAVLYITSEKGCHLTAKCLKKYEDYEVEKWKKKKGITVDEDR